MPLALNGTSSGDAYTAKMQGSMSAQSLQRDNKIKQSNFNFGNSGIEYVSSYKEVHR